MDSEVILYVFLVIILAIVCVAIVGAFVLVATYIPTVLGLSGIMWWAVAIVSFSVLMGLAGGLTASSRE
jgi:hypothetical protein